MWHGFISEMEYSESYNSFLFVLMVSLASFVRKNIGPLNRRISIDLDQVPQELYDYGGGLLLFASEKEGNVLDLLFGQFPNIV